MQRSSSEKKRYSDQAIVFGKEGYYLIVFFNVHKYAALIKQPEISVNTPTVQHPKLIAAKISESLLENTFNECGVVNG